MLSNTTTTPSSNLVMQNSSVASWPVLEPALDKLFPIPSKITERSCTLNSEDFLKLYTLVFEHCVGTSSSTTNSGKRQNTAAGLICGEDLYVTLVKYLENRLIQWSSITLVKSCEIVCLMVFYACFSRFLMILKCLIIFSFNWIEFKPPKSL